MNLYHHRKRIRTTTTAATTTTIICIILMNSITMNEGFPLMSTSSIDSVVTSSSTARSSLYNKCNIKESDKQQQIQQMHSSSSTLYATLFFDDDDDINWDEDDDDDTDFNIQYQGRAFDEDLKQQMNSKKNGEGKNRQMDQSSSDDALLLFDDDGIEDDTDDSYYDNLFKLQSGISILEKDNEHNNNGDDDDDDDDDGERDEITQHDLENDEEQLKDAIKQAEEYHQSMSQMNQKFQEIKRQEQGKYKRRRELDRNAKKVMKMEERAMFLALRALRQQSKILSISKETFIPKSREIDINLDSLLDKSIPSPTLSYSSTRNYKRQDDYPIIENNNSNNKDNANIIDIEKRLYGNRYKNAFGVYLRLLQVLDEMKSEAKSQASDHVFDQIEQSFVTTHQSYHHHHKVNFEADIRGRRQSSSGLDVVMYSDVEKSILMKQTNQHRMEAIIALALFRQNEKYHKQSTLTVAPQKVMELIQQKHDLNNVSIQDLTYILRIRGNVKKRGRIPKSRRKLIEHLTISFSTDIFQP